MYANSLTKAHAGLTFFDGICRTLTFLGKNEYEFVADGTCRTHLWGTPWKTRHTSSYTGWASRGELCCFTCTCCEAVCLSGVVTCCDSLPVRHCSFAPHFLLGFYVFANRTSAAQWTCATETAPWKSLWRLTQLNTYIMYVRLRIWCGCGEGVCKSVYVGECGCGCTLIWVNARLCMFVCHCVCVCVRVCVCARM